MLYFEASIFGVTFFLRFHESISRGCNLLSYRGEARYRVRSGKLHQFNCVIGMHEVMQCNGDGGERVLTCVDVM